MKFTEIDLQIEDVMWFGVDKNGIIFECTSGGSGNVPDFVCKSKEETEQLCEYFLNKAKVVSDSKIIGDFDVDCPLYSDLQTLTQKGIVCFDISEEDDGSYTKVAEPTQRLNFESLPENIKSIMKSHLVDCDIQVERNLNVKHCY